MMSEINIGKCPSYDYYVFTVSPFFIKQHVTIKKDSTVIIMGCNGMDNDLLANVFTNKGCSKVIGWTGAVSMEETDKTTLQIIHTIISGENINDLIYEVNYGKDRNLKLVMIERNGG